MRQVVFRHRLSRAGFSGGSELTLRRVSGRVATVVGVLELGGWHQADLAVQAAVVEPVDVLGDGDLEAVDVLPRALVADELGLEQRVEGLGEGVVVGVAAGADRGDRASARRWVYRMARYWADSTGRRNALISEVLMGRPAGWMKELTGRSLMKSPGAPSLRRDVERLFWREVAKGLSSEEAAVAVGASGAAGSR